MMKTFPVEAGAFFLEGAAEAASFAASGLASPQTMETPPPVFFRISIDAPMIQAR